jgi:iron(III) transport system substrate-binding protein
MLSSKTIFILVLMLFALDPAPARTQEKNWEREWNKVLEGAKREGKVVVAGPPDPGVRLEIPRRFNDRFGVPVEYIGGRGSEMAERMRREREAGLYTVDVFLTGLSTVLESLYPQKMLDPLKPLLILPEVIDPSRWKEGKLPFMDPEQQHVLRLFKFASPLAYINTKFVQPEELRSIKDLLNPKWRGKISLLDPTAPGAGGGTAVRFYAQFGEEFVRKLYVDQKPIITRDDRQITDWLAHGTYPITLNAREEAVDQLQKEGIPLLTIYAFPDAPGRVSGGTGYVVIINKSPHPNAARLFVNWIASREGVGTYARGYGSASLRSDVDETYLPAQTVPRTGANYFDSGDWQIASKEKDIRRRVLEILKK